MGLVENAYQVKGLVDYLISSENVAWSAFAYDSYRNAIGAGTTSAQLAEAVADRYHQLVHGYPHTIAALDISKIVGVKDKTNALAIELRRYAQDPQVGTTNRAVLLALRNTAQQFDSNGDFKLDKLTDDYVDLDHWTEKIAEGIADKSVKDAAQALRSEIKGFVLSEHHESSAVFDLDNARGLAIYYPDQPSPSATTRYTQGGLLFPRDTFWDEFLAAGLDPLAPDFSEQKPNPVAPLDLVRPAYLPIVLR